VGGLLFDFRKLRELQSGVVSVENPFDLFLKSIKGDYLLLALD
jgi:hypothetical protein